MILRSSLSIALVLSLVPDLSAQGYEPAQFAGLEYRCVGPTRGGRATTVAGVASQPGTFYVGTTGGGVWQTKNFGHTWENISDGFFETGSIGAIRVAPGHPEIIYVGTGSDGLRSNLITGRGVYKSTDAGATWSFIGLRGAGQIGAVEVHPQNPDIVYVAVIGQAFADSEQRGVFRSKDGGKSWEKVLYISAATGVVDLELAPDDPSVIYASAWHGRRYPWTIISGNEEGGIFKSSDGGDTWNKLGGGLPTGIFGKSDLAVSPADPSRLYALIEAAEGAGLYRSDDHGATFTRVTDQQGLLDRPFYYCNVNADPTDADVVYVNSTGYYKSVDGGESFRRGSTPHGDNHDMWINPVDPRIFVQCNDGGANVTRDGGETWSTQQNQPTAELYQVAVDDRFPYWLYAGQQDNSTIRVPSLPPYSAPAGATAYWQSIGGCETGPAIPKPGDADIVYANCKGRFGRYNMRTGQEKHYYIGAANLYGHNPRDLKFRFQRVSPIHISPHDSSVIYHASQYLHRTLDEGVTWEIISPDLTAFEADKQVISGAPINRDITGEEYYSTIYAVQESALEKGLIWVGANDGPIHVTRDGGRTWADVTPEGLPPGGRVQTVEPSPHAAGKAYVAVYRFLLGDWQPYIYRTDDYGETWTRLTTGSNGIPADTPTRVVREDPAREGLLYAGTEFGMFISFDDGANWQSFQQNLPATPITDIKVHRGDLVLSTMGRSFWILDDLSPLHQLGEGIAETNPHLFAPRPAYRMRYRASNPASGAPEYSQPGVHIDYYLANDSNDDITLEITDPGGQVLRTFSSQAPRRDRARGQGMRGPRGFRPTRSNLEKTAGMHRFTWNLQLAVGASTRRSRGGPMAVPGSYQARLTVGDLTMTQPFEVLIDPRVAADGVTIADLRAQNALSLRVQETAGRAREASTKLNRDDLRVDSQRLADLRARLVTAPGPYPTPMLIDQLSYLNSMLNRADQKPGRDAYQRLLELETELNDIVTELNALLEKSGGGNR